MNVNDSMPRRQFTVQGVNLSIVEPITAGHVCSDGEASALNQLLVENTRNNLAEDIKEAKERGDSPDKMQLIVDEYVAEYEFGVRRVGARETDPVMAAAREIAFELAKRAARKAGRSLKDVGTEQLRKDAEDLLNDPAMGSKIRAKAEKVAAARAESLEL